MLEHAPRPGGASRSVAATLPGFVHDHCAGFNPMTIASPAIRELELEAEGLRWIRPEAIMAHPFADGTAIGLHHEPERTTTSLERASPGAGVAWQELIERYRPLAQRLVETILRRCRRFVTAWRKGPRCAARRCCWRGLSMGCCLGPDSGESAGAPWPY